ncbi:hypothetical protein IU459_01035 [Nocardia amamiensis]|uniref:Uncharacterized protein n=1 Tax=Nocardia amamiensis TaxID=404578 RepID=A0ABS0CHQ5_9NOCA|nr:hypothetical protein [Nocardia amamiensis]MBF6296124.1 hypothetical protein [Nocardia amamiensis]
MGTTRFVAIQAAWQRRDLYEREFGLRSTVDPDLGALWLEAGLDTGVRVAGMPAAIGRVMRNSLLQLDMRAPAISHADTGCVCGRSRRWQFLSAAAPEDVQLIRGISNDPILVVHRVSAYLGMRVRLPTPGDPRHVWIDPPVPGEMPHFGDFIEGVRHVLTQMSGVR